MKGRTDDYFIAYNYNSRFISSNCNSKSENMAKQKRINKLRNAIKRAPLSYYIVFSFSILILYTIVEQVLAVFGFEPNDTLTTCFFSTFGGEVLCASLIKIFKLKGAEDE